MEYIKSQETITENGLIVKIELIDKYFEILNESTDGNICPFVELDVYNNFFDDDPVERITVKLEDYPNYVLRNAEVDKNNLYLTIFKYKK